jgi:hypothetical protein
MDSNPSTLNILAYDNSTWTDGLSTVEQIGPIRQNDPIIRFRCDQLRATNNTAKLLAYYQLGRYLITKPSRLSTHHLKNYTLRAAKRCYALYEGIETDLIGKDPSITIPFLVRCSKAKLQELRDNILISTILAGAREIEEDNLSPVSPKT